MKKKLLTLTLLLSTAMSTSHTMFAIALGATSGNSTPDVMAPGVAYDVTKHNGKQVTALNAHVQKTDKGHRIISSRPGSTVTVKVDGKEKDTATVAYTSVRSTPNRMKEGDKVYIHNPKANLRLVHSNKKDDNAGSVNITNKHRSGGQNFIRIRAKDAGFVQLADKDGNIVKEMNVVE